MRPYLLIAALGMAALVPSASAVPGACVATAEGPYTAGANVHGYGTFACALPESGMTVTVCVDVFGLAALNWQPANCATKTAATPVTSVTETGVACVQGGPSLVRISVYGSNAAGASAYAATHPVWAPGVGSCGP